MIRLDQRICESRVVEQPTLESWLFDRKLSTRVFEHNSKAGYVKLLTSHSVIQKNSITQILRAKSNQKLIMAVMWEIETIYLRYFFSRVLCDSMTRYFGPTVHQSLGLSDRQSADQRFIIGKKVEVSVRLFDIFERNRVFIFLWESCGSPPTK